MVKFTHALKFYDHTKFNVQELPTYVTLHSNTLNLKTQLTHILKT